MAELILRAEPRTVVGKQVKQLRRQGLVPGVVYGPGLGNNSTILVSVNRRDFDKFYLTHGYSTLFAVDWGSGSQQVFIREVQIEPVKRTAQHIDFFSPNLQKELTASVPVVLRHAAAHHQGILNQVHSEIEVSALPRDFPHEIAVDASGLTEVGDTIRVSDLRMPRGVTVITAADEVIATLGAAAVEEVAEEAVEAEAAETTEEAASEPTGDSDES